MSTTKKVIALLFVFCMVFSLTAFAQQEASGAQMMKVDASQNENAAEVMSSFDDEYVPGLPALNSPKNLVWNKNEFGETAIGHISWDPVKNCEGEYNIDVYLDGEWIDGVGWIDLYDTEGLGRLSVDLVGLVDFDESGKYTFAVQAVGDHIKYNNSEPALSEVTSKGVYNFVAPTKKLSIPQNIFWAEDGVIKHKAVSYCREYRYDIYDQHKMSLGCQFGRPDDERDGYMYEDLSRMIESYSHREDVTAIYITVTALTENIEEWKNSDKSVFSSKYDIRKQAISSGNVINSVMEDFYHSGATAEETRDNLLKEMDEKKVSNTDLAISMAADDDLVAMVGQLEDEFCAETGITVGVENSAEDSSYLEDKGINPGQISVVGAALNSDSGKDVNISFAKADDTLSVDEAFYKNSVAVEINIDGVKNSGKLDIPIQITMPIPQGVLEHRFTILHYHADGTIEKMRPAVEEKDGKYYATFILTSFSPFVFCNEELSVSYNEFYTDKELVISSSEYKESVLVVVAAYQDGKMMSMETKTTSLESGDNSFFLRKLDTSRASEIRVFIWDSKATLKPIIETNIINVF